MNQQEADAERTMARRDEHRSDLIKWPAHLVKSCDRLLPSCQTQGLGDEIRDIIVTRAVTAACDIVGKHPAIAVTSAQTVEAAIEPTPWNRRRIRRPPRVGAAAPALEQHHPERASRGPYQDVAFPL